MHTVWFVLSLAKNPRYAHLYNTSVHQPIYFPRTIRYPTIWRTITLTDTWPYTSLWCPDKILIQLRNSMKDIFGVPVIWKIYTWISLNLSAFIIFEIILDKPVLSNKLCKIKCGKCREQLASVLKFWRYDLMNPLVWISRTSLKQPGWSPTLKLDRRCSSTRPCLAGACAPKPTPPSLIQQYIVSRTAENINLDPTIKCSSSSRDSFHRLWSLVIVIEFVYFFNHFGLEECNIRGSLQSSSFATSVWEDWKQKNVIFALQFILGWKVTIVTIQKTCIAVVNAYVYVCENLFRNL